MNRRYPFTVNNVVSRRTLLGAAIAVVTAKPASAMSAVPRMPGYVGDYFPFDTPQSMPPITFSGVNNVSHDLGELSGKVVLLNFWATWCAPCLAELPDLDRLQAQFPKDQFVVLALCEDAQTIAKIETYYLRRRVETLGQFIDPMGRALQAYAVPAVPTSFILDRTGKVRGILPGAAPWNSAEARALVAYSLNERRGSAA
jgi:thiol-disulfide isomerase/thioredoxin